MKEIELGGIKVELKAVDKLLLKVIPLDIKLSFDFYQAHFSNHVFYLLVSKRDKKMRPLQYKKVATLLESRLQVPIVFQFDSLLFVERTRLISRGVYFIIDAKYVYLPFMIINTKQADNKRSEILMPSTQYVLFYHLQVCSLNKMGLTEIVFHVPYPYASVAKAMQQLEDLELIGVEKLNNKKIFFFNSDKSTLWNQALKFCINPISRILYTDNLMLKKESWCICGINALSYYTQLNPDEQKMYALDYKRFKKERYKSADFNVLEGALKLELWKYPPLKSQKNESFVDILSLYLSLKDEKDSRVEKELEQLINQLWLKD